jgi:hypothetical protein
MLGTACAGPNSPGPLARRPICVNTSKQVGDVDQLKVFANEPRIETLIHRLDFNDIERRRFCDFCVNCVCLYKVQHPAIEVNIITRHPR